MRESLESVPSPLSSAMLSHHDLNLQRARFEHLHFNGGGSGKLLCWILTYGKRHSTNVKAIHETWGSS
jgi:hypothetical protein